MEHKEGLSPEPASLSPLAKTEPVTAGSFRPAAPSRSTPHQASVRETRDNTVDDATKKVEEDDVARDQRETDVKEAVKMAKANDASSRTLPSVKDLIPSLQDLLSRQESNSKLYAAHLEQDGIGKTPAEVQYDAYLSNLKQKVLARWNVSSLTDIREGTTIVRFVVGSDGSLRALELTRSSGMMLRDHEAMTAIRGSFPLKPPPETLLDESGVIRIQFSFHYMVYPPYSRGPWQGMKKWVEY